jgi:hypothetical protein
LYKLKDSLFITKRAVAINIVENDSVYIHGKKLMVTGKEIIELLELSTMCAFTKQT